MTHAILFTLLIASSPNALNYPAQIDTPANVNITQDLDPVNTVRIAPLATLMLHPHAPPPNPHLHMKTYFKRFKPLNYQ